MKKLLILLIGLLISSCSTSDDSLVTYQDPMPIETVNIPDEFILDETYEITLNYIRPTTCHAFNGILYKKYNNERTVVVIGTVFQSNGNCTELETELEASFNFKPTETGSYIFKFWQGKDENDEDIYLIIEVPVLG